jgi:hypothetical protein
LNDAAEDFLKVIDEQADNDLFYAENTLLSNMNNWPNHKLSSFERTTGPP